MIASRIALIHATPLAMAPVSDAFRRLWPQAELMQLLDDRLSADLDRTGTLDEALRQRFIDLACYAKGAGARAILFTCSAFGPAIDAARAVVGLPTYKPNEAMFLDALSVAPVDGTLRVGLLSSFAPSVAPMSAELHAAAKLLGRPVELLTACVPEALQALSAGDAERHDALLVERSKALQQCDVVMLGQFSMARAQAAVAARLAKKVLTSPDSAVGTLKRVLAA